MAASLERKAAAISAGLNPHNVRSASAVWDVSGEFGMKTDEHHPQRVVGESFVRHVIRWRGQPPRVFGGDAVLFFVPALLALQGIEREIFCHLRQPRGGIVRHAAIRPRLQRAQQRLLHHVLGQLQPVRAEMRGERGDHFRAFMTKKMVGHLARAVTGLRSCGLNRSPGWRSGALPTCRRV